MSSLTVDDGALVPHDPSDGKVYTFDWSTNNLAAAATITKSNWKISCINGVDTTREVAVTSINRSSNTATVVTATAHGYATGDYITIAGAAPAGSAAPSEYNGTYQITKIDATSFSYPVANTPATPATGTITAANGIDSCSILSASPYDSRYTQLRFTGGVIGAIYEIANLIVTSESPAQGKERSFQLKVENR